MPLLYIEYNSSITGVGLRFENWGWVGRIYNYLSSNGISFSHHFEPSSNFGEKSDLFFANESIMHTHISIKVECENPVLLKKLSLTLGGSLPTGCQSDIEPTKCPYPSWRISAYDDLSKAESTLCENQLTNPVKNNFTFKFKGFCQVNHALIITGASPYYMHGRDSFEQSVLKLTLTPLDGYGGPIDLTGHGQYGDKVLCHKNRKGIELGELLFIVLALFMLKNIYRDIQRINWQYCCLYTCQLFSNIGRQVHTYLPRNPFRYFNNFSLRQRRDAPRQQDNDLEALLDQKTNELEPIILNQQESKRTL